MIRYVKYNNTEISYDITRKAVKNLNLRVSSEGTVKVSVPYRVSFKSTDEFVLRNAEFILKALEKARKKDNRPLENVPFLGNILKLKVFPADKNFCRLTDTELWLYIKSRELQADSCQAVQSAVNRWEKEKGKELFPGLLKEEYIRFIESGLDIPFPSLTVRNMKTRWGSCTAGRKKICLNASLVEKPVICIEYVICHELSHFLVQNHSADFYSVLDRVFPSHREVKRILNESK